ncbi:MAG: hypothetical protein J6334_10525, partial [Kiritimatiellae bacterium]|nr:hypothetical protein [Kiritimatiellia bacterium]
MNRRPANPVLILPALVTRRVIATASGSVTNAFVYDGYLQIADSDGNACVWDPTEPVATRPLARVRDGSAHFF